jgi:hypothetical protein
MKDNDKEANDEELDDQDIDEEKKELEQYWKTQLEWVSSAFSQSRDSFLKIVQWFLAIGTGTLLWFSGNFDKFKITSGSVGDNTTTYDVFMPMKELYFSSLFLLVLSVIISASIIIFLYYYQHLSDTALDRFNAYAKDILDKYDLIKTTRDINEKEKLEAEIISSLARSKQPFNLTIDSKRKVVEIITDKKTKLGVTLSAIFYILGLILGILYIILFIYFFW